MINSTFSTWWFWNIGTPAFISSYTSQCKSNQHKTCFYQTFDLKSVFFWMCSTVLYKLGHTKQHQIAMACGHWVMIPRRWRIASRCRAKKKQRRKQLFMMLLPHSILNCIYFSESSYCKVANSIVSCLEALKSYFF